MSESKNILSTDAERLKNLIVIGDKVLVKLKSSEDKTRSGLYLPPGVEEKEAVRSGFIMKVGPGYPVPFPADESDDIWKDSTDKIKYIPLQVKVGDLALFLQKNSIEIIFKGEKYFIISQHSILMVERDEALFD
ncbi:MAG: co-chaperone GroES family protein [Ignavibacteriaceae bacterium]|jgi:Co-chaperonin GroES (HSP10)|nr:MAG: co-chaperone GroES [Chlorobiota bacterium]KXK02541.1 MAG: Co-chaperonin GroES [Chlorobi bacterium OLB4]MBV6398134.1 10 kDa chaperonin [Ignavibacteria bacterium]MCC6886583.1 co-chaperone GroES [Ignavibacteriales bacterium]MCE7952342.1 co-chaperone GroES [Chlorobi bacterium CHB7]MDL1886459.1 co-chaperone GroES [Ignavibacteria bacterium CHB1]MEB2329823.1 co-chaperone GroES family protein [Ignavibacteriaceae bacterium]OQY77440.1 MAG: chaperonin [Ignavibacteriales bacterium UTCHB1]RIK480